MNEETNSPNENDAKSELTDNDEGWTFQEHFVEELAAELRVDAEIEKLEANGKSISKEEIRRIEKEARDEYEKEIAKKTPGWYTGEAAEEYQRRRKQILEQFPEQYGDGEDFVDMLKKLDEEGQA